MATNNILANWWRSQRFKAALKQGNRQLAENIFREIQRSGAKLSWLEKLFEEKYNFFNGLNESKQEVRSLYKKLNQYEEQKKELLQKLSFYKTSQLQVLPEQSCLDFIVDQFQLIEHQDGVMQCTGIHKDVFDELEIHLVDFLVEEFQKINPQTLKEKIQEALEDINQLKAGKDPNYQFSLTPHVYFIKYFLNNVYCTYLVWFLVYKSGLLQDNLRILDIAAGPGTVAFGLALFLESISDYVSSQPHISYYSLEQQAGFQYRGLQFWRQYIENQSKSVNAYFRFNTSDVLQIDPENSNNLPRQFFDCVIISHCFFVDAEKQEQSFKVYKQIFQSVLKPQGYILLIVQGLKLLRILDCHSRDCENEAQEKILINRFLSIMGLELIWYYYLSSTGTRDRLNHKFAKFAEENLPPQIHMSQLSKEYFGNKYISNYCVDDYVIMAKLPSDS